MTRRKRLTLPDPLPDDQHGRALWFGYESARWFPFDASLYLERVAKLGAPVQLAKEGGAFYAQPVKNTPEHDFPVGWHNGSDGAVKKIVNELSTNERLQVLQTMAFNKWSRDMKRRLGGRVKS